MDHPLVKFFTRHVIEGRDTADLPLPFEYSPREEDAFSQDVFQMLHRVATLYDRASEESPLAPTTICVAVDIWSEIDNWTCPENLSSDYELIHGVYASAMFIWLHLTIHPDKIDDGKIQGMVSRWLREMVNFHGPSALRGLLLIPLFIHSVASIRQSDRDVVDRQFVRLRGRVRSDTLQTYQAIVHWTWERQDNLIHRSWDWADWGGADRG